MPEAQEEATKHIGLEAVPRPDRYEPLALLGSGGVGVVFRVRDRHSGREVALKTLARPDAADSLLLKHEFRALERLVHPNLVQLYDLEVNDRDCYFTMEVVEGGALLESLAGSPPGPARDPAAVRAAFAQLAEGLMALHEAGKLHRDVKPLNVLVEPAGRVVLVDYGLVMAMDRQISVASQRGRFAGTFHYTSPEQAWGRPITPAADWYSVGVMLYECLTARLPVEGPGLGALLERRHRPPAAPEEIVPSVDRELAALAMDLLHFEPEARPPGHEILARLRRQPLAPAAHAARRAPAGTPLVGRKRELDSLRRAFEITREGRPAVVDVAGASGMGKSALVEHFLRDLERDGDALVLRSRCHPRESVRFDAVDGMVDDLSRALSHVSPEELAELRPEGVPALNRVFPVLARVPFAALDLEIDPSDADPLELRRRAFGALRQLLARIAHRRPLVLWADDLQWGDRDSASFLEHLLRGAEPPPLLLVLSYRADESSPLLSGSEGERVIPRDVAIDLEPLPEDEAGELMQSLLEGPDQAAVQQARALASEAEGSPYFIGELARYFHQRGGALPEQSVGLGHVLSERMRALSDEVRSILEVVAVAGRPIDAELALELAGVGVGGRPSVYELCQRCWLRTGRYGDQLDTYHGRVRDAVIGGLPEPSLRQLHRELAAGLSRRDEPDALEVLEHTLAAGDEQGAALWADRAAEQATAALAFDQSAELFAQAHQLRGARDDDWDLLANRALALAQAGRGARSAEAYAQAAAAAHRATADDLVAARLRGLQAEQHLYAGNLGAGKELMRGVLEDLDIRVPKSGGAAIRSALGYRVRFLARQTWRASLGRPLFDPRPARATPDAELVRMDLLHGVARGLSMLDHTLADALGARHLVRSLALGERSHALRALGLEASFEATVGGRWLRRRSQQLLDRVGALATEGGDPFDEAWVLLARSNSAWFGGQWRECVELGNAAVSLLRERCIGIQWETSVNHVFTTSARAQLGQVRDLEAKLAELSEDARSRGDTFGLRAYRNGDTILVFLAADDAARARRELADAAGESETDQVTSAHYTQLIGDTQIELYEGRGGAALERVEGAWRDVSRAGFLRLECVGLGLRWLRARAAIAAGAEAGPGSDGAAQRLARVAEREASQVRRCDLPHAAAFRAGMRAGAASLRGQEEPLARELLQATEGFERAEMKLHAAAARFQLGRVHGGEAGVASVGEARAWMAGEGIRDSEAMVRMLIPLAR